MRARTGRVWGAAARARRWAVMFMLAGAASAAAQESAPVAADAEDPPAAAPAEGPEPADAPGAPLRSPVPVRPLAEAVELEPGETCLERDVLTRRVARWLERDTVDERIRIEVRGGAMNSVKFTIHVGEGHKAERAIHDASLDCDQLHSALALSIALAIDAALMDAERARAGGEALPSDDELLEVGAEGAGGRSGSGYFKLALGVLGHATSGLLTDVAFGASLRIEIGLLRWLDLRAGVFGSALDDQTLPGIPGRFSVDLIAGRLEACVSHDLRQLRLSLCSGGLLGSFRTRGEGFSGDSFTQSEPWAALSAGVELQAQLTGWLSLAAGADAVVPLHRRAIVVLDPESMPLTSREREVPPLALVVAVGPVFRLF
jgi:hypothetical protein